jgi:hypothetical protein
VRADSFIRPRHGEGHLSSRCDWSYVHPVTRPVGDEDLDLLVGVLAVCESVVWTGGDLDLTDALRQRWSNAGLVAPDADAYVIRQLLNDLNHRLRYAKRETNQPPVPVPLPE